ncbi:fibrobacter succinogenes major paralogous domain [Candidatus Ornithobacterium hominis]|uniref:FISUMP domain-containing protein n=1 Tax=Candidatus Ornithobacterium hominis TaxID=2497989 RepID=UPI000E5ABBD5|nr:FISUMP domain-containing protein [Candidatus Ornithobacterium hominis]SZD73273.1 fibrobacter succinogenes major paralogous domain [Candidatus Ornithobacterium hominis]
MKKLLLSFVVLPGALAMAQVGINTDEPKAMLDISAKGNQRGDLRIQDVKEEKSTQWLLIWDEKDNKLVKRTSLSEIKREILNEIRIDYIRKKYPDRAGEIINKIKQCTPENILFDKHFGDGKHDFVYCATIVTETATNYNKTWLNLNLGAEYADIHSSDFNPTVNKTGETIHGDKNLYGSLYQWQRVSDGHEFRNRVRSREKTFVKAPSWTNTDKAAGKFIFEDPNWVEGGENASGSDLALWRAGGRNNPCPSGYHVPTLEEWEELLKAVRQVGSSQDVLPNLAAAGYYYYLDGLLSYEDSGGYYWSSSASDRNFAHHMYFNSGNSGANGRSSRANGFSVRCIKN